MPAFESYLQSISAHYGQWWTLYTLMDVEQRSRKHPQGPVFFDFGLMARRVEQPQEQPRSRDEDRPIPVLEGLKKYAAKHVLLIGRPGSGKSTTLARLVLELVDKGQIPVLVELRSWQTSIVDLICNTFKRHDLNLSTEQVQKLLDARSIVLLIDGVNELPSEAALRNVSNFRRDHSKVPMIFTTRDLGLGGDLGIEEKLEMQPLTEDQIETFVQAYLPDRAELMLRQLKGRLRELGKTPLLLWMLCSLFRRTEEIPKNLGEVFRTFTRVYEQQLKQDVVLESDRRLWADLLKQLAATMMQGKKPTEFRVAIELREIYEVFSAYLNTSDPLAPRKALDDLLKHHLIQRNGDLVEFRHQLIQEYYAAEWLLDRVERLDDKTLVCEYLNYLKWTEPISLMLALCEDEALIKRLVKKALDVDLYLGARLVGSTKSDFHVSCLTLLKNIDFSDIQVASWFTEKLIYNALIRLTNTDLIYIVRNIKDEDLQVLSIKALSERPSEEVRNILFKLLAEPISKKILERTMISLAAVIEKPDDANNLLQILFGYAEDEIFLGYETIHDVLQPILKNFKKSTLVEIFQSNQNIQKVLIKLMKKGEKFGYRLYSDIQDLLKPDLDIDEDDEDHRDDYSYIIDINELYKFRRHSLEGDYYELEDDDIEAIIKALKSEEKMIIRDILGRFQDSKDQRIVDALVEFCPRAWKMNDAYITEKFAKMLGKLRSDKTLPCLLDGIHQIVGENSNQLSRRDYHQQLIIALGKVGGKAAFEKLTSLLHHDNKTIRHDAVIALAYIQSDDIVPELCSVLRDSDSLVAGEAAGILAELKDPRSLDPLYQAHITDKADFWIEIYVIQNQCRFYNYTIFQKAQTHLSSTSTTQQQISASMIICRDYIAGDNIQGDKVYGNKTETTSFPNAQEVKIFENVENYHQEPNTTKDLPT